MNIALVTDSTADIPDHLLERHQIHVVPNMVVIDGKSMIDGQEISRREFYERLPGMKIPPTTATLSSGAYQVLYQKIFDLGAEAIISIHAASRLSGIFNAAQVAAQEFGQRVYVLDGEHISLGLGFQVLAAADAISRQVHLQELLAYIVDVRRRARVMAMLDTLEYVRRSGRVSWARARLGNLLQVKPFIEVREGGRVFSMGEARTRSKGVNRLKKFLYDLGNLERLAILHTNAEAEALQFLADIDLQHLPTEPLVVNVTPIIGTHVGPNGLGFAAIIR
jgi:DegV family protein with EDD domain